MIVQGSTRINRSRSAVAEQSGREGQAVHQMKDGSDHQLLVPGLIAAALVNPCDGISVLPGGQQPGVTPDMQFDLQMRLLDRRACALSRLPIFLAWFGIRLSRRMRRRSHLSGMARIRSGVIYMCNWSAEKDRSGSPTPAVVTSAARTGRRTDGRSPSAAVMTTAVGSSSFQRWVVRSANSPM